MDRSDASALADLQMHWDEAYVIGLDGNIWSARYRRSADELRAHTCSELRELIRSDYAYRQKADLVAYDGDEDDRDEDDRDEDEVAASEDGAEDTGAEDDGPEDDGPEDDAADGHSADAVTGAEMDPDDEAAAAAARANARDSAFATIRGERMST
ncbi:MAG TPA: hypothetical protein VLM11_05525 [Streptosporangiaceae bacterium]|nr:hypothetical protein [Streptosporangiaceae bacterium]